MSNGFSEEDLQKAILLYDMHAIDRQLEKRKEALWELLEIAQYTADEFRRRARYLVETGMVTIEYGDSMFEQVGKLESAIARYREVK